MSEIRELIIIGGGPAGYTAALYSARANLSPLVIEGFQWGGQLMITSDVENYPGYPDGVMGPEMMADFRRQAERFGAEFLTDDVTRVDFSERPFRVWVGRRRVPREGGDRRHRRDRTAARPRVRAARCRAAASRTARPATAPSTATSEVIVVGGGDSAMEEAIFLTKFASKVTLVHRRDEFRASQIMLDRAQRATRRSSS